MKQRSVSAQIEKDINNNYKIQKKYLQCRSILEINLLTILRILSCCIVMDNLNTHKPASLYEAFEPNEARRLLKWIYGVNIPVITSSE